MIMSQVHKYPTIRLFGRTIQLAPNDDVSGEQSSDHNLCYSTGSVSVQSLSDKNHADTTSSSVLDHQSITSTISSSPQSASEEQGGSNESQDNKPLKKPTKILPCPRCNSSDTKFCYFNNYNMNQPRHFCRDCQRYWTAGGSMRNMAVGAGRRKTKNISSSSLHQEMNPDSQKPATINFQAFAPIWPNPAIFPVPVYASTPYWTWVNPDCTNLGEMSPNSPLGKHPRETNKVNQGEKRAEESTVLVPKTLRFDDPTEAAMSSIWTTLGIKNQKKSSRCFDSGAFFGGFELRGEETSTEKSTRMLQANPAALSRSLTFHEIIE